MKQITEAACEYLQIWGSKIINGERNVRRRRDGVPGQSATDPCVEANRTEYG